MITESTVVFYKDSYDTIYIVDKKDSANSRDIEYQTILLTPRIPGREDSIRIQDGVAFKYGLVGITREIFSLDGATGSITAANIFYSNDPFFEVNKHLGKTVKVRNYDGHTMHLYDAIITEIIDKHSARLSKDFEGTPSDTFKGTAHLSFDSGYSLLTSGESISEDFIRVTYDCGWANDDGLVDVDFTKGCGSRLVNTSKFRFGPLDNFRVHLDNAISDECESMMTSGSCFAGPHTSNVIWPFIAEDGSAYDMDTWEPSGNYDINLAWIDVWEC
jgi:hypothetical protein